ncbi:MAG: DUF6115 domain-containing protein [Wujia sp.]
MSTVVVVLIILGIIFIFASFGITSKLEKDETNEEEAVIRLPRKLSDEQKEKIDKMINDYMDEHVEGRMSEVEAKLSEIVNEKTLALGDYAVTVNDEIERNHNEVMFLYSMLSDKQKEIMTTATMVDDYRKDVEAFVSANNITVTPVQNEEDEALEEAIKEIDDNIAAETQEEEVQMVDSSKDVILEMHKSGLSILEIAKHLGLGVGEVKLVVDLYQGETKE